MVALRTKRAFPCTRLPAHWRASSMPGLHPAGMGYPFAGALGRQLHDCLSLPAPVTCRRAGPTANLRYRPGQGSVVPCELEAFGHGSAHHSGEFNGA